MSDATLTTEEAAERLGVTVGRVRQLIVSGRLPAQKFGHLHSIRETDLKLVEGRKPGRPPKPKVEISSKVSKKGGKKKDPARLLKTLS
jgi:excisionase family DNA binding protein